MQELFLLTVGNGTTCGGGFQLTPRALLDDSMLDVTIVRPIGVLAAVRAILPALRGDIDRVAEARQERAKRIVVESAVPLPVHTDGELLGGITRIEIEVVPKALTVIC